MNDENMKTSKVDIIRKKIEQLKAQEQALVAREKVKERKARDHRIIQVGAIIDSRLKVTNNEEANLLCDWLYNNVNVFNEIKKYISQKGEVIPTDIKPKEKIDTKPLVKNDVGDF